MLCPVKDKMKYQSQGSLHLIVGKKKKKKIFETLFCFKGGL